MSFSIVFRSCVSGRGIAAESPHVVEQSGTKEDLERKARPGA